jgi:pimeloyl-ACP methyl ester carboxylesterase
MRAWCDGPYRRPEQVDSAVRAKVLEMASGTGARRPRREIASLGRGTETRAAGRLGELRMPILAVVGSLDMPDILEIVDSVVARVPGVRRVDISGVAHNVNMERPAEFLAAILPFLRERAR